MAGFDPALDPADMAGAYAIQDALIAGLGQKVGGWKVAAGTGDTPICSPLPASGILPDGATLGNERSFARLAEAEVGLRIGTGLPPRDTPYTDTEITAAIAAVMPVIELIGTALPRGVLFPHLYGIGDFQSHAALILGPEDTDWQRHDFARLTVKLQVNAAASQVAAGPDKAAIVAVVRFLANGRAREHGGLPAGTIITTGSRTLLPVTADTTEISVDVGGLGNVRLVLN